MLFFFNLIFILSLGRYCTSTLFIARTPRSFQNVGAWFQRCFQTLYTCNLRCPTTKFWKILFHSYFISAFFWDLKVPNAKSFLAYISKNSCACDVCSFNSVFFNFSLYWHLHCSSYRSCLKEILSNCKSSKIRNFCA